jgi:hypothetical protein
MEEMRLTSFIVEMPDGRFLHYRVPDGIRGTVVVRQHGTLTAIKRTFDEEAILDEIMRRTE